MDNERLHYGDKIIYMEGVIVAVDDCSISVDLKGRLGFFKAPEENVHLRYRTESRSGSWLEHEFPGTARTGSK